VNGAFLLPVEPESRRAAYLPGDWLLRGGGCEILENLPVFINANNPAWEGHALPPIGMVAGGSIPGSTELTSQAGLPFVCTG